MLELKNLHVHYGKKHAIQGISLHVNDGELVALLGPNGCGKTTALRTISGLLRPSSGQMLFDGRAIHNLDPRDVVKAGIVQVPQGRQLFRAMTVFENLEMGAFLSGKLDHLAFVYSLFPRLKERARQTAATLSGGEAQMLAIGRGLMASPKLLLLDEPTVGLSPLLMRELGDTLKHVCETGIAILLVEQNTKMALEIAHRAYILKVGAMFAEGSAEEIQGGDYLRRAYFG